MSVSFLQAVDNAVQSLKGKSGTVTVPLDWLKAFKRVVGCPEDGVLDFKRGHQVIHMRGDKRLKDQVVTLADVEPLGGGRP